MDTCGHRGLMAEVARQLDQLDARIFRVELAHDLAGVIAAAVVNQNDLPRLAGLIERGRDAPAELGQVLMLVEYGCHHGDHVPASLTGAGPLREMGAG